MKIILSFFIFLLSFSISSYSIACDNEESNTICHTESINTFLTTDNCNHTQSFENKYSLDLIEDDCDDQNDERCFKSISSIQNSTRNLLLPSTFYLKANFSQTSINNLGVQPFILHRVLRI